MPMTHKISGIGLFVNLGVTAKFSPLAHPPMGWLLSALQIMNRPGLMRSTLFGLRLSAMILYFRTVHIYTLLLKSGCVLLYLIKRMSASTRLLKMK